MCCLTKGQREEKGRFKGEEQELHPATRPGVLVISRRLSLGFWTLMLLRCWPNLRVDLLLLGSVLHSCGDLVCVFPYGF